VRKDERKWLNILCQNNITQREHVLSISKEEGNSQRRKVIHNTFKNTTGIYIANNNLYYVENKHQNSFRILGKSNKDN